MKYKRQEMSLGGNANASKHGSFDETEVNGEELNFMVKRAVKSNFRRSKKKYTHCGATYIDVPSVKEDFGIELIHLAGDDSE